MRQKAEVEIGKQEELAEPALRKTLAGKPPLEQYRRIERILERIRGGTPRHLFAMRVTELLEQMSTTDARRLLQDLAKGAPRAWLTREARAALKRLERRARITVRK